MKNDYEKVTIMWLPTKEERELIEKLVENINRPEQWYSFEIFAESGEFPSCMNEENLNRLQDYELVEAKYESDEWKVKLTKKGWELGRKYQSCSNRIGLWCEAAEHKWLWYIITYVLGILSAIIAQWIIAH